MKNTGMLAAVGILAVSTLIATLWHISSSNCPSYLSYLDFISYATCGAIPEMHLCEVHQMCTIPEMMHRWHQLENAFDNATPLLSENGPVIHHEYMATLLKNSSSGQIPSLTAHQMDLARRLVKANVPFVLRSVESVQRLVDKWDQQYLQTKLGGMTVLIQHYKEGKLRYTPPNVKMNASHLNESGHGIRTRAKISQLFQQVGKGGKRDMLYGAISGGAFKAYRDYNYTVKMFNEFLPLVQEHQNLYPPTLRFGFDEIQYAPHFDRQANFLVQVKGIKRVFLLNPVEERFLYWQKDLQHPHYRQSYVWPRMPQPKQKHFKHAMGVQVTLYPGDALYIPPLWWHYIESRPPTTSIHGLSIRDRTPFWLSLNADVNLTTNVKNEDLFTCK